MVLQSASSVCYMIHHILHVFFWSPLCDLKLQIVDVPPVAVSYICTTMQETQCKIMRSFQDTRPVQKPLANGQHPHFSMDLEQRHPPICLESPVDLTVRAVLKRHSRCQKTQKKRSITNRTRPPHPQPVIAPPEQQNRHCCIFFTPYPKTFAPVAKGLCSIHKNPHIDTHVWTSSLHQSEDTKVSTADVVFIFYSKEA
jgi:hypothetical protein